MNLNKQVKRTPPESDRTHASAREGRVRSLNQNALCSGRKEHAIGHHVIARRSSARRARMRLRSRKISVKNWAANTIQCGLRAERTFPEIPDQIVRRNVDAIRALAMHKHNARLGATRAVANPGNETGSHGVSDPSGQARGHIGRAQRGRSRHGLHPHSHSGTCSGRQRAPPIR